MEDAIAVDLKEIGLKVTPQRRAILKLLQGNRLHPSAERIFFKISKEYPGMSFATVYNTLSKLVEAGKIQELDVDPDRKRFDPCVSPHCHFYCKVCGKVFDVVCDTSSLMVNTKKNNGHQIDGVQVNFKGVCKGCRTKG